MQPTIEITPEILQQADQDYCEMEFIPVHGLAVNNNSLIVTPDDGAPARELILGADARAHLANFVGAPSAYLAKLDDPALTNSIWNYHIQKRGSDVDVLKAVVKENEVRTFTTRSFHNLAPSQIIQAVREAMPDAVLERALVQNHKALRFHVTNPDLNENFMQEVAGKGDVHHFSLGVEYNFLGDESPNMRGYGHRHNCGNIMEAPYGVGGKQFRIYTTEPQQVLNKFTEFTRKGMEFIRMTMIPHIRATMEARLTEPVRDIQDLVAKHNMPERVEELLFEAYRTEDLGGTMYHLINAITRAANSDRCPPQWVDKLRNIAGTVTVSHDPAHEIRRCEACHQKVVLGKSVAHTH